MSRAGRRSARPGTPTSRPGSTARGASSPLQLLPEGSSSPNTRSIGIELVILPDLRYTDAQYRALARLVVDIERRHQLPIASAPSRELLGHEDVTPIEGKGGRANTGGGWDPGAHRSSPYFDWARLWKDIERVRAEGALVLSVHSSVIGLFVQANKGPSGSPIWAQLDGEPRLLGLAATSEAGLSLGPRLTWGMMRWLGRQLAPAPKRELEESPFLAELEGDDLDSELDDESPFLDELEEDDLEI